MKKHGEGPFEKQKNSNQRRIQKPPKHLQWSVLQKQLTSNSYKLILQGAPS